VKIKLGREFVFTTELGGIKGVLLEDSIAKAKDFKGLDALNVHDCPGANLRINSIMAASILQKELEITTIPHFACRDRSLLGMQADLLGAHALGIRYILPTTGDGPQHGPFQASSGVYDYNTVELMGIIDKLNQGVDSNGKEYGGKTEFVISATATPQTKNLEKELNRMQKKIEAGADFFQTQAAYDPEKIKIFVDKAKSLGKPILLGIMPLKSPKMASFVSNIPGITIPEKIMRQLEAGKSGFEIATEFIAEVHELVDGLHIFGMGDVGITNKIIEFTKELI